MIIGRANYQELVFSVVMSKTRISLGETGTQKTIPENSPRMCFGWPLERQEDLFKRIRRKRAVIQTGTLGLMLRQDPETSISRVQEDVGDTIFTRFLTHDTEQRISLKTGFPSCCFFFFFHGALTIGFSFCFFCRGALRSQKPCGVLGRAQYGHLDFHTAPELWNRLMMM